MHKFELVRLWQDIVACTHMCTCVASAPRHIRIDDLSQHSSELVQHACTIAPTVHIPTYKHTNIHTHTYLSTCARFFHWNLRISFASTLFALHWFCSWLLIASLVVIVFLFFFVIFFVAICIWFRFFCSNCFTYFAFFLLPLLAAWQPAKTQIWLDSRHVVSATTITLTTFGDTLVKRIWQTKCLYSIRLHWIWG